MGYVADNLMPDETVFWSGREHWLPALSRPITAGILALVLAMAGAPQGWVDLLGLLTALTAVPSYLLWRGQDFAVTDRRVIAKEGVIGRGVREVPLRTVESTSLDQGAFGVMAGYGTVVVVGTGGTKVALRSIARPGELRAEVQDLVANLVRTSGPGWHPR